MREAVADLLRDKYGFQTRVLHDATRADIMNSIWSYRTFPENSSFLLYYAGHGHKDPVTKRAYWIPVDAQDDSNANWISASDLSENISAIPARHILIISDSCFSGDLTNDREINVLRGSAERDAFLSKLIQRKSRDLLASGGDEPVADGGGEGHSIFASILLQTLREMDGEQFGAADIFFSIQHRVGGRSDQLPRYSYIQNSGDDGGDFFFSRYHGPVIPAEVIGEIRRNTTQDDAVAGAKEIFSRYQTAFENRDMAALVRLWPGISGRARKENTDFFGHATNVRMNYKMSGTPVIANDKATVRFSQELSFTINGRTQTLVNPQVTMTLKRAPDQRGEATWQIGAVN